MLSSMASILHNWIAHDAWCNVKLSYGTKCFDSLYSAKERPIQAVKRGSYEMGEFTLAMDADAILQVTFSPQGLPFANLYPLQSTVISGNLKFPIILDVEADHSDVTDALKRKLKPMHSRLWICILENRSGYNLSKMVACKECGYLLSK